MMRKRNLILVCLILMSFLVAACGDSTKETPTIAKKDQPSQLRVGAATTTSWIYGCMVTISEVVKRKDPTLEMVIQSTAGSTTHYGMMQNGELDLGSGYTPTDFWAMNGTPPLYNVKYKGAFYSLAPVTVSSTQVIVKAGSPINSLSDLKGKRVFVGDPGAASTALAVDAIKLLKLDVKQFQTDLREGYEMLKDGRVDAFIRSTGIPFSGVLELASSVPIKLIPFSDEEVKICVEGGPYNSVGVIRPQDYKFLTKDVQTLNQIQNINISPKISNDLAYKLVKTIWENWNDVVKAVPATGKVSAKDIVKSVAPVHPGAIKYYEEQGIKIPDHLTP